MARRTLIRSKIHPYHVTARVNNKEHFYCSLPQAWEIFGKHLAKCCEEYGVRVHAFVLMPNHFHLLVSTPEQDLGIAMRKTLSLITKAINSKSRRSGRVFGARYHWSLVSTDQYLDDVLKYIYRNPVKAQLCERVEDYAYSSLVDVLAKQTLPFSLAPVVGHRDLIPNNDFLAFLHWLNKPMQKELDDAIRKGFKKSEFAPAAKGWMRKKSGWEDDEG